MNKKIINTSVYLGLFLLLTGVSYFAFDKLIPAGSKNSSLGSTKNSDTNSKDKETGSIQFPGPKNEICPINGASFTKAEKDIWSTRRPLLVMIENHSDSRPQSGLENADIVYEAVAEGGITRFMGVFYCGAVKGSTNKYDVGPVRSARTYYLDLASEYADYPLYNHVGGANCSAPKDPVTGRQSGPCTTNKKAQAIEQISDYGWNNQGTWGDLSEFSLSYKVCRREPDRTGDERATEHTMYCSTSELWNVAATRGLTNVTKAKTNASWDKNYRAWTFKQTDKSASNITAANINMDFWSSYKEYSVNWKYNKDSNNYSRFNGTKSHVDFNTGSQLTAKNIVVQNVKETRSIDEHLHNLYEVIGTGTGVLFQNGEVQEITWSKANRASRTIYKDKSGKEVNFVPGQTWIEILPISSKVTYEAAI